MPMPIPIAIETTLLSPSRLKANSFPVPILLDLISHRLPPDNRVPFSPPAFARDVHSFTDKTNQYTRPTPSSLSSPINQSINHQRSKQNFISLTWLPLALARLGGQLRARLPLAATAHCHIRRLSQPTSGLMRYLARSSQAGLQLKLQRSLLHQID